MKDLKTYIQEGFKLGKNKVRKTPDYKYFPKDRMELYKIIEQKFNNSEKNLNDIDTSNITNMSELFYGLVYNFNFDISEWNVSNVEDMHDMFYGNKFFNCDLSEWDVSNCKNMNGMFYGCASFNSDLSNWDISNVRDIGYMFYGCRKFDSDLSNWNTSNVDNMSSVFMLCNNLDFDVSKWDVSNVYTTEYMFSQCFKFTGKGLENWKLNSINDINYMFAFCRNINPNLSSWGKYMKSVTDVSSMFYMCENFEGKGLEDWDVSNFEKLTNMFNGCKKLNVDFSKWKLNKSADTSYIFDNTTYHNKNIF